MNDLFLDEITEDFEKCWHAARSHLQDQIDEPLGWQKVSLDPPFLEHMSIVMGNQLFFIQLEDVDQQLEIPGKPEGLFLIANGCKGYACVMPMRKSAGEWAAATGGWGLLDARTRKPISPPDLLTDELIEMTDWELQNAAVQIIKEAIENNDHEFISAQSNPEVEPALWFKGPEGSIWFVIRVVRYPEKKADKPNALPTFQELCDRHITGSTGYFVSVLFTSLAETFDARAEENGNIAPLYRGKKVHYQCTGVEQVTSK